MFEQPTNNQSNLQQPRDDLQQNSPSLQQGGTTTQDNTETVNPTEILTQPSAPQQLRVLTQSQNNPASSSVVQADQGTHVLLLVLLIVPIIIIVATFWPRKKTPKTLAPETVEKVEPSIVPAQKAVVKRTTKKKTTKHKRSKKR